MKQSETKAQIIEVARKLFAKRGVESITMNDIAVASEFGRRTLYTYFKSKEELFWAVVASEQAKALKTMEAITDKDIPADEKIIELIYTRLRGARDVVSRNGSLRGSFFRDIWMVEHVRKEFDLREMKMIEKVLTAGKEEGVFKIEHIDLLAEFFHYCIKGLEVPFIRGKLGKNLSDSEIKRYVKKMVFTILGHDEQAQEDKEEPSAPQKTV